MTLKASSNKFHPAFRLYKYSVKRTMGITVLLTVFFLLVCPGYTIMHINNNLKYSTDTYKIYDFNQDSPALIMIVTVATTAAAMLYLFINFAFLYGRSSSDFYHALPLTRRGLLTSRLLAGITPIFIPMTLTYAAMCGLLALDSIEGSAALILRGYVFNVLVLLACCAFLMIFIVVSGSIFDLIISFFTFNAGIVVVQLINQHLCENFLEGFPREITAAFIMRSSPFVYIFATFGRLLSSGVSSAGAAAEFAVKLIALTVIPLIAAYLLYSRRKSEKSGVSYAYRFIYIVCAVIVGIVGAYLLGIIFAEGYINFMFWIFAAVGGLLASVTFGAINDRGFKSVKKSLVIGGCSVLCIALLSLFLWSGAFGYSSRIPEAEKIKSASVSFDGYEISFDDPSLVLKLHNEIIGSYTEEYGAVDIDYELEGGRRLKRTYYINYEDYEDTLLEIYKSEESIESIKKSLSRFTDQNLSISLYTGYEESDVYGVYLTAEELRVLTEAYLSDIPEATVQSVNGGTSVQCEISGFDKDYDYIYHTFYIEDGFANTLRVIDNMNLKERPEGREYVYQ